MERKKEMERGRGRKRGRKEGREKGKEGGREGGKGKREGAKEESSLLQAHPLRPPCRSDVLIHPGIVFITNCMVFVWQNSSE